MDGQVDVVIVNWNAGEQLRACVKSVLRHDRAQLGRLIVVDNASIDGSADRLPDDPLLTLIRSPDNLGFGRACNLGAREGSGPFVLFLNPDTRLVAPTLARVGDFLRSDAGRAYGICGVRLEDEDGEVARHASRFPSARTFVALSTGLSRLAPRLFRPLEMVAFDHREDRPVDHVMGAFYFMRRSLFDRLGGFDERFFVYYEDLDLSRRAAAAGQGCFYLAGPMVYHKGAGTSSQAKGKALSYILESRLKYARKHFGTLGIASVGVSTLLIDPVARLAFAAARSPSSIRDIGQAYARLWRSLLGRRIDRR